MVNKVDACDIIEYWKCHEFFKQNNYYTHIENKKSQMSKSCQYDVTDEEDLLQCLQGEVTKQKMACWGNIVIYLGKISRDICTDKLVALANYTGVLPEKNTSEIAFASLQLNPDGTYMKYSFSLSPVLWAIKQKAEGVELSLDQFLDDIRAMDMILSEYMNDEDVKVDDGELSPFAVPIKQLRTILNDIYDGYVQHLNTTNISVEDKNKILLSFTTYTNRQDYYKRVFNQLHSTYFLEDMEWVAQELTNDSHHPMIDSLAKYIMSPNKKIHDNRQDVVNVNDTNVDEYSQFLFNILDIKHTSIAKWPSAYRPALMQQIAINMITNNNHTIFSVNGPPGTGKTTLLKEIIANNIVERAKQLIKYNKSDDLFIKRTFQQNGDYYNRQCNQYYEFKDDTINDYSMLVVSSNNTAVENITKDLPIKDKLINELKSINKNELLREFNQDIYFSSQATKLLNIPEQEAWGLIGAPLGKRENINHFKNSVLVPILKSMQQNSSRKQAERQYQQERLKFKNQLKYTQQLQEQLDKIAQYHLTRHQLNELVKQENENSLTNKVQQEYDDLTQQLQNLQIENRQIKNQLEIKKLEFKTLDKNFTIYEQEISQYKNQINIHKSKVKWIDKFFNTKNKIASDNAIALCEQELATKELKYQICQQEQKNITQLMTQLTMKLELSDNSIQTYQQQLDKLHSEQQQLLSNNKQKIFMQQQLEQLHDEIKQNQFYKDKYTTLDKEMINQLLSADNDIATRAQISNPWLTDRYDQEREKLFISALKVTKYFILSSSACYSNLNHLYAYWSGAYLDGNYPRFKSIDKPLIVPALFQTLFLLVPIISSTFASINSFFKDAKQKDLIGLLLIDEAGQAQPHMSLGALCRSKKALVVGDPKQIEPVVTEDFKVLKYLYTDEKFTAYKDTSLSVQNCADLMNSYGSYLNGDKQESEWLGSPLIVHRRCISPMYDISNSISYNGMMKQQTALPSEEKEKTFITNSGWINIIGHEVGQKNHYNATQGAKVIDMVVEAFKLVENTAPSLFIISPFNSVISGIKKDLESAFDQMQNEIDKDIFYKWLATHLGTVHKFQGKEADQVIVLLGCDQTEDARGAIKWVNSNIINVAVTRAKYRVYMIGDIAAWQVNPIVYKTKCILNNYAFLQLETINETASPKIIRQIKQAIPSKQALIPDDNQQVNIQQFIDDLIDIGLTIDNDFLDSQLHRFNMHKLTSLSNEVNYYLHWGIKLFYLLEKLMKFEDKLSVDMSCCGLVFCKVLDLQIKDCLGNILDGIDIQSPQALVNNNHIIIASCQKHGLTQLNQAWWQKYLEKFNLIYNKQQKCNSADVFNYNDLIYLLANMFKNNQQHQSDGLMIQLLEAKDK